MRVFITGASSGIGEALALRYAQRGAALALFARRPDRLEAVAAAARAAGAPEVHVLVGDTTEEAVVRATAVALTARWPVTDRVFLNAGGGGAAEEWLITECCDDRDQAFSAKATLALMQLNFTGAVWWLDALMPAAPPGSPATASKDLRVIALTGSLAADGLLLRSGPYMASKMAVRGLVYGLGAEAETRGVRLCLIEPGFVATAQAGGKQDLPFLLSADQAAAVIVTRIERGDRIIRLPWQMSVANRLSAWLPRRAYVGLVEVLQRARGSVR